MPSTNNRTKDERLIEARLREVLLREQLSVGTAESCTGGRIAATITSEAGSSAYFSGGIISYSNEVKQRLLSVSAEDLEAFGAVSRPVVEQMASGAIEALSCDCAVATSGIAGPGGGTPEKPVGTVWIAAAVKNNVMSECFHFEGGDRESNIHQAVYAALEMLLRMIG